MTIKDILKKHNLTMTALSKRFGIPYRTIQNWTTDKADHHECPAYIISMINEILSQKENNMRYANELANDIKTEFSTKKLLCSDIDKILTYCESGMITDMQAAMMMVNRLSKLNKARYKSTETGEIFDSLESAKADAKLRYETDNIELYYEIIREDQE